jgi:hypothetical protein
LRLSKLASEIVSMKDKANDLASLVGMCSLRENKYTSDVPGHRRDDQSNRGPTGHPLRSEKQKQTRIARADT